MLKTKVIKLEKVEGIRNGEIIVSVKTSFWNPKTSTLSVKYSDEYVEEIKGHHKLLDNLYDKFENNEAVFFMKRYEAEETRKFSAKRSYLESYYTNN